MKLEQSKKFLAERLNSGFLSTSPATPDLSLRFEAPGMDVRAGELSVMDIPWGVCASSARTGLDEASRS